MSKKKQESIYSFLCGIQQRVADRMGVHRSFVSRVAKGERTSAAVQSALDVEMGVALKKLQEWAKCRQEASYC